MARNEKLDPDKPNKDILREEKKLARKYVRVWNVHLLCYDNVFEAANEKHEYHINNHKHLKKAKVFCDECDFYWMNI